MSDQYTSVALADLQVGEPLPVTLYIYLDFRFITFRAEGDVVDRTAYDRLEFKGVKNLFVHEKAREPFAHWLEQRKLEEKSVPELPSVCSNLNKVREDIHRKTMDIFHAQNPDKAVVQALTASKRLVNEVMKIPFAIQTLSQLQTYSKGTVDHSVNVSILSIYLAMQMGYAHQVILEHVGMGALLHDIGKPKVIILDGDSDREIETKMREHASLGAKILEGIAKVPNEVKMIVAQHHENHDGTGYPNKLRGVAIYDLARIVSIANVFDELVGEGQGILIERQRSAIQQMDQVLFKIFDPQKLEKALRILKLGV